MKTVTSPVTPPCFLHCDRERPAPPWNARSCQTKLGRSWISRSSWSPAPNSGYLSRPHVCPRPCSRSCCCFLPCSPNLLWTRSFRQNPGRSSTFAVDRWPGRSSLSSILTFNVSPVHRAIALATCLVIGCAFATRFASTLRVAGTRRHL